MVRAGDFSRPCQTDSPFSTTGSTVPRARAGVFFELLEEDPDPEEERGFDDEDGEGVDRGVLEGLGEGSGEGSSRIGISICAKLAGGSTAQTAANRAVSREIRRKVPIRASVQVLFAVCGGEPSHAEQRTRRGEGTGVGTSRQEPGKPNADERPWKGAHQVGCLSARPALNARD